MLKIQKQTRTATMLDMSQLPLMARATLVGLALDRLVPVVVVIYLKERL